MDPRDEIEPDRLEALAQVFREQLLACLEECSHGRRGLFSGFESQRAEGDDRAWPEAERLRELALALQTVFLQQERKDFLCEEFLDLCTIHGENDPGERRLARAFLERIEKNEVGTKPEGKERSW
ncbi:MAG: hypothetical protein ABR898_02055 [Terracidiphilus sp.]|jgi:hypothetical protein